MKSKLSMILALFVLTSTFVAGCAPSQPSSQPGATGETAAPDPTGGARDQDSFCAGTDPATCESHADCVCVDDDGCFLGNKAYYERCEDKEYGCPDFCGEMPVPACIEHQCTHNYPRREWDWTFADCERVPETETSRCQALVAWSVARHDLEGTLERCETLGTFKDVCYQHVAESIAVENVDQAEEICDEKIDPMRNNYCYSMVAQLVSGVNEGMLDRAIDLCGKIDMQATKDECYQRLARHIVTFKSPQYALDFCHANIQDPLYRDICLSGVASVAEDPSICATVAEGYEQRRCLTRIYERVVRSIVESQSEQDALDFCHTGVEDALERDVCLTEVAHMSTDESICEKVVDAELKGSCMVYIEINQEGDE